MSVVASASTMATRSLSAQFANPAPLSASSHAHHSSRASAAASNASVSDSTPFVAVTVSAAVARNATAAQRPTINIFLIRCNSF